MTMARAVARNADSTEKTLKRRVDSRAVRMVLNRSVVLLATTNAGGALPE
ncbi:hypothetical protein BJG93_25675 [Paraburkholderia sprentiae WSM5005]|uniref:Uncharacterized protein n=1 Tax=Paraburkholderia sprentiae WSM5005 TaxID=754502 RepID=A0A1I9YR78_9BURK|nr:hypothetical protein [Paraburkholderia sprentiae]APA88700.2 hypothetical protein BJG93_25675 [Paraburkholderia sprentiae WSM5005]